MGRLCHWALQETYYIKPLYQTQEMYQLYLTHRHKHRQAAKMMRKLSIKEQNKTPEKELNKIETSNLIDTELEHWL